MREDVQHQLGTARGGIRIGIGGWSYEPWRGVFYPANLPHARELHYASRALTSIEINATFYRTQKPATFAAWAAETPPGFVFAVKAPRYATQRGVLAEAGPSIERFLSSGVLELGSRLGPILWQLPPTKRYDEADVAAFLELLPPVLDMRPLRHAIEVRHASFATPSFVALARRTGVAIVYAEHATYPAIPDITAPFVYARLQKGQERLKSGYSRAALDAWARRFRQWAAGEQPDDLPPIDPAREPKPGSRDVFAYVIHDAKIRAPAAASALIERLSNG